MKQTIKLTESKLREMINEAVRSAILPPPSKKRKTVSNKLTESRLRNMIKESVKRVINEVDSWVSDGNYTEDYSDMSLPLCGGKYTLKGNFNGISLIDSNNRTIFPVVYALGDNDIKNSDYFIVENFSDKQAIMSRNCKLIKFNDINGELTDFTWFDKISVFSPNNVVFNVAGGLYRGDVRTGRLHQMSEQEYDEYEDAF